MAAPKFLSEEEKKEIADAIGKAEQHTIGEIRVYAEKKCKQDPMKRGLKLFQQLGMQRTRMHTGVLIYVAHDDHKMAIIGDEGIHEKVKQEFWDEVMREIAAHFSDGNFVNGLKHAINRCGTELKKHFPADEINPNELSNEMVIGNE